VLLLDINLINICKKYGDFEALKNITFDIKKNSITSIVGLNGSGKTTLVKCLSTLLIFDSGDIVFFGEKFTYKNYKRFRRNISLLLDASHNLYLNLTLLQNIKYFLELHKSSFKSKKSLVDYYLELFSLHEHKDKLVSSLSKGMQQKTALIIALSQDSNLVILDEPNLALDLETLDLLKKILKKESIKKTILLTTQDIKLIEDISDYLVILDNGKLKFSGKMEKFYLLFDKATYTFYLDRELSNKIKSKLSVLGRDVKFINTIIKGNFKKHDFDKILSILKEDQYKVLDIKMHGDFENNILKVLDDGSNKKNVSII